MNSLARTVPVGADGEAVPVTMGYVQQLRRECRVWRLRLADAEKEIARLRIGIILAEHGAARPVQGGAA